MRIYKPKKEDVVKLKKYINAKRNISQKRVGKP
jgi:hypothetical protein